MAQSRVDTQGFTRVALVGKSPHEELVPALAERREFHQLAPGSHSRRQFSSANPHACRYVCLERPDVKLV